MLAVWYYCKVTCLYCFFVLGNHSQEVVLALILIKEHRRYLIWVSFKYVTIVLNSDLVCEY